MSGLEALIKRLRAEGVLSDPRVEEALRAVPRERFLPPRLEKYAYVDEPIHIGHGQTCSAPHMVVIMLQELELGEGMKVLEVGTGSGWNAALLAYLVGPRGRVVTVERIPALAEEARRRLKEMGFDNVKVVVGDGSLGYPDEAPYDRIIVTAAAPEVPPPLVEQLAEGGILLIPVGGRYYQDLLKVEKVGESVRRKRLMPVVFVPLVGRYGYGGG
ncbi:MAG: protein-L-isoaspartate O-methyltransferase [Thermoplasmata archaeon]|nr:MAG: protein-L-isoaspartate O-methyltransferase [Thermoplasmata archaeon]HDJ26866.1 protein-L-isoaspartate(D-aspartate) O-methyltransferase [Aciduliprofundum sp.]